MALATQCPHCNTIFRVAHDQLKLRGGIVRCGACHEVFDGNAALLEPAPLPPQAGIPGSDPAWGQTPAVPGENTPTTTEDTPDDSPGSDPVWGQTPAAPGENAAQPDPFEVLPLSHEELEAALAAELAQMAHSAAAEEPEDIAPPAETGRREPSFGADVPRRYELDEEDEEALLQLAAAQAAAPTPASFPATPELHSFLHTVSAPSEDHYLAPPAARDSVPEQPPEPADDPDEPSFLKRERHREKYGKAVTIAMALGALLLLAALVLQGLTSFRNQLAASVPALKPPLQSICAKLGCKLELPAQIDELAIEQGELQTLSDTTFSFTTQLRNNSASAQAWPHIELILDDANDKAIVRRVFTPRDYLGADVVAGKGYAQGFAPHSEQSVKLYFELKQLKASGYHIAVFYP